jgi:hypothetical protein
MLQLSRSAAERLWCAQSLQHCDCSRNPEILDGLVKAAREDADSMVRIACVRSLAKLGAPTSSVLGALDALKADPDRQVRFEANLAFDKLSARRTTSPYAH